MTSASLQPVPNDARTRGGKLPFLKLGAFDLPAGMLLVPTRGMVAFDEIDLASPQLRDYEPPVMTRIHASDGALLGEYARERRLYLPIQVVPKRLIEAFLAAEDKTFYTHGGIDPMGLGRAIINNAQNYLAGRRGPQQGLLARGAVVAHLGEARGVADRAAGAALRQRGHHRQRLVAGHGDEGGVRRGGQVGHAGEAGQAGQRIAPRVHRPQRAGIAAAAALADDLRRVVATDDRDRGRVQQAVQRPMEGTGVGALHPAGGGWVRRCRRSAG